MEKWQFDHGAEKLNKADRQRETVLRFLCGQSDQEIAEAMNIAQGTVRQNISYACQKFGLEEQNHYGKKNRELLQDEFEKYIPRPLSENWCEQILNENNIPSIPIDNGQRLELSDKDSIVNDDELYISWTELESKKQQAQREIAKFGGCLRIEAPRQTGRTSFVKRVLKWAELQQNRETYTTVYLDFENVFQGSSMTFDLFLRLFCYHIKNGLESSGLELQHLDRVENYWNLELSSKFECTNFFESNFLEKIQTSTLVIGLDNIDRLYEDKRLLSDFLGLLREWSSKIKKRHQYWIDLKLILVSSRSLYIDNITYQSPFNIGTYISLPLFQIEQVLALVKKYGIQNFNNQQSQELIELVGDNPYLIHEAIRHISKSQIIWKDFLITATDDNSIYQRHLEQILYVLEKEPELQEAMQTVVNSTDAVRLRIETAQILGSLGLIKIKDSCYAKPSCQLYRQYFQKVFRIK